MTSARRYKLHDDTIRSIHAKWTPCQFVFFQRNHLRRNADVVRCCFHERVALSTFIVLLVVLLPGPKSPSTRTASSVDSQGATAYYLAVLRFPP